MLPDERRQYILDKLTQEGRLIAKDVSHALGVSEDTIRRDLRELAEEGLLQRVHGGALPASPAMGNFGQRETIHPEEKIEIGRSAARLVHEGQVIILDGGTTAIQVARHLPSTLQATVVTHSPRTAIELIDHQYIEVILIGGTLFKHSIVSVGAHALESIRRIRADIYFMGVTGIHPETGLSTGDYEEAQVKLALSNQSAETYVLASDEKLGSASPYIIAPLAQVTGLVVSHSIDEAILEPYKSIGLSVISPT